MKLLMICLLAVSGFFAAGCASSNVNPAVARQNTGYVDFYVTGTNDLYWEVTDIASNKKVFSEFRPLGEPVLRLAFKPGRYEFQVTFLNRVIAETGTTQVDVRDSTVTPVTVTLVPMNPAAVQTRNAEIGKTFYSRSGRRTRTTTTETVDYKVTAEPQPPLPYRPKELMPYFHPAGQ